MSFNFSFLKSRFAALYAGTFLALIYFCIDWSMQTTFRGMSFWELYASNALLALVLMLPYMLTRKIWAQALTIGIADCALVANLMYRRTYFTPIPPESYLMVGNLGDFTASVTDSLHWLDLGFPLLLAATVWLAARLPGARYPRRWRAYLIALGLLALVIAAGLLAKGGFSKVMRKLSSSCYYNTTPVQIYTPVGYLAYTAMETEDELTPEVAARVDLWLKGKERLRPYVGLPDSVAPRKNLVVVLLESFEGWLPENEIDGKPITPYINSLLKDSATFFAPRVLSQVSSGRSIDGQLLIFTGLLPRLHTIFSTKHPANFYPTLNKALREKYGTKSYIFTCDRPITWNQQAVSPAFGYDAMYSRDAWNLDDMIGRPAKLSDQSFFRQSVDLIRKGDLWPDGEPRLLTFVSYSGHNPWLLPDEKKDPDFDLHAMDLNKRFADYATMAHYTDAQLHIIIDYLKSRPDYDETLVVITGDHEGLAYYRDEIVAADRLHLVSDKQFVPLIILNSPVGGQVDEVVGQYDIYPTLLGMLGLDDYPWKGLGQTMLAPVAGFAVSSYTQEVVGDTIDVDPALRDNILGARSVSDDIIHFDMLRGRFE